MRLLGGERLFQSASSWSKCWDWAKAACSGFPIFCWEPMFFISAIFEISSMLVDTENLLLRRSSTWAIMTDDVKWAYFFCHEYVSSESSFFSSLLAGRFAAAGRKSANKFLMIFLISKRYIIQQLYLPSTSLAGAEYVGNLMYCAGELCKQIMGNDGLSLRWTSILEHSKEISKLVTCTCSWRDVKANPRNVSHTIIVLSSLPDTAVVPLLLWK